MKHCEISVNTLIFDCVQGTHSLFDLMGLHYFLIAYEACYVDS